MIASTARLIVVSLFVLLTTSCATLPTLVDAKPPVGEPPAFDEEPQLCLAFSGGGLRAGTVAMGALQAFHDADLLTNSTAISVVSGGGYPVYGILARSEMHPDETLDMLLSDSGPLVQAGEKNSLFVSRSQAAVDAVLAILSTIVFLPFNKLNSADLVQLSEGTIGYSYRIHKTFASTPPNIVFGPSITNYDQVAERLNFPLVIFQASASNGLTPPRIGHKYKYEDVFELTPRWIGSREDKYWESFVPDLRLVHAVIASAAAIDTPDDQDRTFRIPNFARSLGFGLGVGVTLADGKRVFLSDGGFIENQAVIPLLERRCKQIIAVDASHDPSAGMSNWTTVQKIANRRGWSMTSVTPAVKRGAHLPEDVWSLGSHLYESTVTYQSMETSSISILKLGLDPTELAYPKVVEDAFSEDLQRWNGSPGCIGKNLDQKCTFPMQSTSIQAYSEDEFRAYRCLGYHLANKYFIEPRGMPRVRDMAPSCRQY